MKVNHLRNLVFCILTLSLAAIGCGKSSGGPSPAQDNVFIGNWSDSSGNPLTISTRDTQIMPDYPYSVNYNSPEAKITEPCQLTNPTTLTCASFGPIASDTLVYNQADSTIAFTIQMFSPARTIVFHKSPN